MCGIVGYAGAKDALAILLNGLSKLEYRGYDSAGVAVSSAVGIRTVKAKGRLACLAEKLKENTPKGSVGIGHTRWATHGEPSDRNSHPHGCGKVTLVHNGIIENYAELKNEMLKNGEGFLSETDTEVVAHLLNNLYEGNPQEAIRAALKELKGSYALAILFADRPDEIWATRKDSPMILGLGEGENFIASDIPAVLSHTRRYLLPEPGEIACVTKEKVTVYGDSGCDITSEKKITVADWDEQSAEKGGYPHFMLKEIYEQPESLRRALEPRISGGIHSIFGSELPSTEGIEHIILVACGSAMHSGLLGKCAIERLARIPVSVEIASEFRYSNPILRKGDAVFVISQSGETADSLAALRLAKEQGIPTYAIVNVVGSSIAREADGVILLYSGPEIAVATTKAYTAQVALLSLLALRLAVDRNKITDDEAEKLLNAFRTLPERVKELFDLFPQVKEIASKRGDFVSSFFIGRGQDYAVCCEGSLKLKEISYIHSEAYAAGELKHGTISLITPNVPCVAVATTDALLPKTLSNVKEIRARGARVLLVSAKGIEVEPDLYDSRLVLPETEELLRPILAIIPLQYYAYCVASGMGLDVDKPRNLAKSVTVE